MNFLQKQFNNNGKFQWVMAQRDFLQGHMHTVTTSISGLDAKPYCLKYFSNFLRRIFRGKFSKSDEVKLSQRLIGLFH